MGYLDLDQAFRHLWHDKRDDAWPDVVGYRDFEQHLAESKLLLEQALATPASYEAGACTCLDMPKKGFTLRPGLTPCIEDRLVYQAVADLYAPHFQPEETVYSHILTRQHSRPMFKPGVRLWKLFQDKVEEYCSQYEFVVETDIAAYFDHVYHRLLLDRIEGIFRTSMDRKARNVGKQLLRRLFGKWTGPVLKEFGIPQMNDASSFFGNVYLDELDKWASAHGYVCLRYVDDIRLFAPNEGAARRALADVVVKLRQMGLYVASAKTRIRPSNETASELSQRRSVTSELETAFDSTLRSNVESVAPKVQELFVDLLADGDAVDDRLFRYCVNRLRRLKAWGIGDQQFYEDAAMRVVAELQHAPHSTDTFVDFLSAFPDHEPMQAAVLDFLEGPYNVYPWQQMHLLELLLRCDIAENLLGRVNQLACAVSTPQHHAACRSKAIMLRGKNGTYADRRDIRDHYRDEPHQCVRRAVVVGAQELQPGVRNNFYRSIEPDGPAISSIVGYVRSLPKPTYHYYNPPRFPDLIDDDSDDYADLGSDYFI